MSIVSTSAFIAFSIALPFGPISLLCIQRSLMNGMFRGLACGAGASTAHGIFACLAAISADAVTMSLSHWQPTIKLVSSAVLVAIGLKMIMSTPRQHLRPIANDNRLADYLAGMMLALTNPATIVPYIALAGSGLFVGELSAAALVATVTGVILGSVTWYATLSGSAWALKDRLPQIILQRLNLLAGPALIAMGLHLGVAN